MNAPRRHTASTLRRQAPWRLGMALCLTGMSMHGIDASAAAVAPEAVPPASRAGPVDVASPRVPDLAAVQGIDRTGATSSQAALQALVDRDAAQLWAPAGTYALDGLDLRGHTPSLLGSGFDRTVFQARASRSALLSAPPALDAQGRPQDAIFSPLTLAALTLDANGLADYALDFRYRHFVDTEGVRFQGARVANIRARDGWLLQMRGGVSMNAPIGLHLVGANHRSQIDGVSFVGLSQWGIKAESQGTAHDGNSALLFANIDVEFGPGGGAYLDVSDATFETSYLGENLGGTTLQVQGGNVTVQGGALFFGSTPTSPLATLNGGRVVVRGANINAQAVGTLSGMLAGTARDAIRFEGVAGFVPIGGDPVLPGDFLDWGPGGPTFTATPWGKSFRATARGARLAATVSANSQTFAVVAASGPHPLLSAHVPLVGRNTWRDEDSLFLLVVYESTKPVSVRLVGGPLGLGAQKILGTMPANASGTRWTYVKLDQQWDPGAYNYLELLLPDATAGDRLTVHEVYLADNRFLGASPGVGFRNLYKPTGVPGS